jgi:hypothetical protein
MSLESLRGQPHPLLEPTTRSMRLAKTLHCDAIMVGVDCCVAQRNPGVGLLRFWAPSAPGSRVVLTLKDWSSQRSAILLVRCLGGFGDVFHRMQKVRSL